MRTTASLSAVLSLAILAAPAGALAQPVGELTLFSDVGFRGQSRTVSEARNVLTVPFIVRSARIAGGRTNWEVCTRANFRGPCNTVSVDQGNVRWTVASARPAAPQVQPPRPPAAGGSLRGMAAEFFPAPADRGGRVASCVAGTAACAQDSARRFCTARGWGGAAHAAQETVGGRNYLADVLCTRSGR